MRSGKRVLALCAAAIGITAVAFGASACDFYFSYTEVTAPLGTYGEIGVRVQKTHNNCTMPGTDEYQFAWENVQVLGSTDWEEIGPNLYERWFQVSLSEVGSGFLRISKDCTKEGYQEATLPITVVEPDEDGLWQLANLGTYPLDSPASAAVETVDGVGSATEGTVTVADVTVELEGLPSGLYGDLGPSRLFFTTADDGGVIPLLLVFEGHFVRLDHLVGIGT